jgi:hypothetical protein
LPDSGQSSRFQHVALLSDAGLRLADKHGNQVRFNPAWRFESMLSCRDRRMVRSVTMGGRRETFHYTIDNEGQVVVASAALSDDTESARPTYVVHYEYDGEGRLCRVDRPEPFVAAAESPRGPALSMVAK